MPIKKTTIFKQRLIKSLIVSGLLLNSGLSLAESANADEETLIQQEKIKARLAEIAAEEKAAKRAQNGYYVERKS